MRTTLTVLAAVALWACPVGGREGDLIRFLPFAVPSPQDIARDPADGTFWITTFLDASIYHYSADLSTVVEEFRAPLGANRYLAGVAYDETRGTLLVAEVITGHVFELEAHGALRGQPTGVEIVPALERGSSFPLGLGFDPTGDEGRGSIFLLASGNTLIHEVDRAGNLLRRFPHPDDPDGYPGEGARAPTSYDVEPILDGAKLAGFWVTGGTGPGGSLRRLDEDGAYTGVSIPLHEVGGTVGGVLRRDIRLPESGATVDAFLCVVQSGARLAVLEGGEPAFKEILDLACVSGGAELTMTWKSPQAYDRIEVREGCETLEVLPGDATTWRRSFDTEGVHDIVLRATSGDASAETRRCRIVVGPGEVLAVADAAGGTGEYMIPVDVASDGNGLILVATNVSGTDGLRARILLFDETLAPAGAIDVPAAFSGPEDYVSGLAYARVGGQDRLFVFNTSRWTVGVLDSVGALVETFEARLPNLEEDPEADPDLGVVLGLAWDPTGDGGAGSLWMLEAVRSWIYEVDLAGNVVREFPHPYLAVEPPPEGSPWGISAAALSIPDWSAGKELYLGGGTLRDSGQVDIFQADRATGQAVPGTAIPTAGIAAYGSTYSFTMEGIEKDGERRWIVVTRSGRDGVVLELRAGPTEVPPPKSLVARQMGRDPVVELRFEPQAPYSRIEVFRDCEPLAELPGSATTFVDDGPTPGVHEYAVRGVADAQAGGGRSALVSASLRVGIGAVLGRRIIWPALSPQQAARDPVDGTTVVVGNWPGDERTLHVFDRDLRPLESHETAVPAPWQPAAIAIRRAAGEEAQLYSIGWQQPVPIGAADKQTFVLSVETLSGQLVSSVPIVPPRPQNGFMTYPTGLVWSPRTDTLFYLERNSATFVEATLGGETIREFPHPSPPFQGFVFALGVTVAPSRGADGRGTILYTTAGRHDYGITLVEEMELGGTVTGFEVPLDETGQDVTAIAMDGPDLITFGGTDGELPEALWIRTFDASEAEFIRGDSDGSGSVNLSDPVFTLNHLFRGGDEPPCLDAADADDSGNVNLTDAVVTLLELFVGGWPIPEPYPEPGTDPTADDTVCR